MNLRKGWRKGGVREVMFGVGSDVEREEKGVPESPV